MCAWAMEGGSDLSNQLKLGFFPESSPKARIVFWDGGSENNKKSSENYSWDDKSQPQVRSGYQVIIAKWFQNLGFEN